MTRVAASSSLSGAFDSGAGKVGLVTTQQTSESTGSTSSRAKASRETIKEAQNNARLFLTGELSRLFDTGVSRNNELTTEALYCVSARTLSPFLVLQKLTKEKYARDFSFQDPISKYSGIDLFQTYLTAMLAVLKVNFIVHNTAVTGDTEITTR